MDKYVRRFDIDWLRNCGILMLFPFHAARIFDYWEPFYTKNTELSFTLSWYIIIASYWFMPLLFFLAGASSWYGLKLRSGKQYIKERIQRLLIPLIFGTLFIVPPQGYFARLVQPYYSLNYLEFLITYFTDFSDLSGYFGTFTPGHLWFILYLFILSLAALPIFDLLDKRAERLYPVLSKPGVFILLFIPMTLTEALPDIGGKNPFFFLFIFIAGYMVCADERFSYTIDWLKTKLVLFLMAWLPLWLVLLSKYMDVPDMSTISIIIAFIRNLALWSTLIVIAGYGRKMLNFNHKWLPYLSQAAFPVYIIHQTVMIAVGFFIVKLDAPVWAKFSAIMLITLAACFIIYEYILRRTAITRWLFGIKIKIDRARAGRFNNINGSNYS